jgi:hypothetical protein
MILILQIAAGIVLGFLILQSLPRILQVLQGPAGFPLFWGTIIGIAVLMGWVPEAVLKALGMLLGALAGAALLMVVIQYSARGLGYLYVWQRTRVAASRRWTNLLRMIGVHPCWHTTDLPRAEIAIKVGDVLFIGLGIFLAFCCLASTAVLVTSIVGVKNTAGIGSTLVLGIGMWRLLRIRRGLLDRAPTPPERAQ